MNTFYDALLAALSGAATYNKHDQAAPAAVLWPDKESQWAPLIPALRADLPIVALGAHDPASGTGPAIWIRCMVDRALPEANWPADVVPIVYLPGVSKQELRAVEECPWLLQPLAELQYRGVLFTQKNGRDWTIPAFLQTEDGGLGIPVAADNATREAARNALRKLADEPVDKLRSEAPLGAAFFHDLMNPDPFRRLLHWMDSPDELRATASAEEWAAFCATCAKQFGFNPETDGRITAAGLLGQRSTDAWGSVWCRFAEAPGKYANLPELLRGARPPTTDSLLYVRESWPQENEQAEADLRAGLTAMAEMTPDAARQAVRSMECAHAERRKWVWAALNRSPLAEALVPLARLAEATEKPLLGATPRHIADAYALTGWMADAAALDALAVPTAAEDVGAVKAAVGALYRLWLQSGAELFQAAVASHPLPTRPPAGAAHPPKAGRCVLFADGLRYDIARRLSNDLELRGFAVAEKRVFGALPSITDTAKPAATPIRAAIAAGSGFATVVAADGAKVTAEILRRELASAGYAALDEGKLGDPAGAGWTECGTIDSYGHEQGWKLARRVDEVVGEIRERVVALLGAGWQEVRIVTDHGWLLLPGGLPKCELPEHLTELRKGRCARMKPASGPPHQVVPWFWDPAVTVAVAPGIGCYTAGKEYEHGGLSPQECVLAVLTVSRQDGAASPAAIEEAKWTGLRCHVRAVGAGPGTTAALRSKPADPASSLSGDPKPLKADGKASLVVADDDMEGAAAVVVLLDAGGQLIAQKSTIVGEGA